MTPCACHFAHHWITPVDGADPPPVMLGDFRMALAEPVRRRWVLCRRCGAEWVTRNGTATGVLDATIATTPTEGT